MKYALVILVLILAIVAAVVHLYRESVVREIANAALAGLGLTATDLAVDTIGTRDIRFSELTLEQDDGTVYELSGLTFPLSFPSARRERIAIGELVVTPAEREAAPLPLAPLLRTLLRLPDDVPNAEVTIERVATAGFPPARDVAWRTDGPRQSLAFSVEAADVMVEVERLGDDAHGIAVNAAVNGNPDALALQLNVVDGDAGVAADGHASIDAAPWVPVLGSYGVMPAGVAGLDAKVEVQLRATAPETLATGRSLEWSARIEQADVRVHTGAYGAIPVRLAGLECRPGIRCALHALLDAGPLELDTLTIAGARLAGPLSFAGDDAVRVDLAPDFVAALTGVESTAFSLASVATTDLAGARLIVDDDGWRVDVDRLGLEFAALTDRDKLLASGPVDLEALRVRAGGAAIDARMSIAPKAASLAWDGTGIVVPGIAGDLALRDGRGSAALTLTDDGGALAARVDASVDIASGTGAVAVRDATLGFDRAKLSQRLVAWPYAWDIVAGRWTASLDLDWRTGADGVEYAGTTEHAATDLAGQFNDSAFAGLSTKLSATLDSTAGIDFAPSSLAVALVDVGLPLEQIAADYALDVEQQAVRVENLALATLGGRITADPFRFGIKEPKNDIILRAQSIQLKFIMDLVEFEDIELAGSISGVIPVTISDMQLTISNGQLQSDPPGGVIRYRPGIELGQAGTSESALDLVSRALAHFQFDSLTSGVDYLPDGEMKLKMRLSGVNPDMNDKQPVILNLEVENNIPQMLRSLRATRSIEDVLARKTAD